MGELWPESNSAVSSTSFPPPPTTCPPGQHPTASGCVGNMPGGGDSPVAPFPQAPGPAPAPTPAAPTGGEKPADCAAKGMVWRNDTHACEFEDARHNAGQDTCGGPLPQCPPGQDVWCDFTDAQYKCARSSWSDSELCDRAQKQARAAGRPVKSCAELGYPGGGGGGASGGGGRGSFGGSGGFGASGDFASMLQNLVTQNLNQPSRYTPEALQSLYGEITRQRSNQITRGERAVRQSAAQRGMSRAGATGAALRGVHDVAEQQSGAANVGVMTAKINADYADKNAALDRAQKYLDSMRDNEYRYTLVGEQRRQFDANLALAYANMAQQRSMLNAQLQSQWDMLRANQGFWLLTQSTQ
jgi:hypothetical protein